MLGTNFRFEKAIVRRHAAKQIIGGSRKIMVRVELA